MPFKVAVLPTVPLAGETVRPAITVKLVAEVALFDEASVTTTLCAPSGKPLGIVKVTVDEPLLPVVAPTVMVAGVPPTVTVSAEVAAKPSAVIVAEDPTAPVAGVSPVADALIVKLVDEVAVLDDASVTTRLWTPLGAAGMVNVTVDAPLVPVVPPKVIGAEIPPTITVSALLAANPWARIVTPVVPTVPVVGVSPVAEAVTVKLFGEVARLDEASVTTTV